jgi:hypothetical protein
MKSSGGSLLSPPHPAEQAAAGEDQARQAGADDRTGYIGNIEARNLPSPTAPARFPPMALGPFHGM